MLGTKQVRPFEVRQYLNLFSVENSKAQLQHQLVRIENLELMGDYGAQAWLKYNETLNQMVSDAQK